MPSPKGHPRRRITDEDWEALVEHYRQNPADHAGAAKLINASGATVRRCWEFGQKNVPGRPPIQKIVTRENFEMRAELADLRRTASSDKSSAKKNDVEDGAVRAQQQVTLRNMRAVGNAGILVGGKLMGSAMELARSVAADISDPKRAISTKDKMKYANDIAKFAKTMGEFVMITEKLQREFDGGPDLTVAAVDIGAERALEMVLQSQRTARRLTERVANDGEDADTRAKVAAAADAIDADVLAVKSIKNAPEEQPEEAAGEGSEAPRDDEGPTYDPTLDDQLVDAGEAVLSDIGYDQTDTSRPGPHARAVQLGDSSNLTEAFHDAQTGYLWVTFNSGRVYRYSDIPESLIDAWEDAPNKNLSYGQFFIRKIKGGGYAAEEV